MLKGERVKKARSDTLARCDTLARGDTLARVTF